MRLTPGYPTKVDWHVAGPFQTYVALPVPAALLRELYVDWGSPRTVDIEGGLPGGPAERMFMWRLQEDHSRRSTGLRPLIG